MYLSLFTLLSLPSRTVQPKEVPPPATLTDRMRKTVFGRQALAVTALCVVVIFGIINYLKPAASSAGGIVP